MKNELSMNDLIKLTEFTCLCTEWFQTNKHIFNSELYRIGDLELNFVVAHISARIPREHAKGFPPPSLLMYEIK